MEIRKFEFTGGTLQLTLKDGRVVKAESRMGVMKTRRARIKPIRKAR